MMPANRLRISLVIPAYNEENHLRACLESVAAQDELPFEVIVVDNNSQDNTAIIARSFPFVRLLHERRQGIVYARNTGFDAARGDIIARIDADVTATPDWVRRVRLAFERSDRVALTGFIQANVLTHPRWGQARWWSWVYARWSEASFGIPVLCGANLALRRDVWRTVRSQVCLDPSLVHEDQDLSLLIAGSGGQVQLDPDLLVVMDDASHAAWPKALAYAQRQQRTKRRHIELGTLQRAKRHGTKTPAVRRAWLWVAVALPVLLFAVGSFSLYLLARVRRLRSLRQAYPPDTISR